MKNQYFGDIGDYGKYSLLRAFAKAGVRVGVNWYLTEYDGSQDGKHTRYLENKKDRSYDPELFDCIKQMVCSGQRDVRLFERKDMIPRAVYYHEKLDISGIKTIKKKMEARIGWHVAAIEALKESELVFLDPDNGLKNTGISGSKKSMKYAFASEVEDYFRLGHNIVYYCHKGRRTPGQWETAKAVISDRIPEAAVIALTFHRGTQRTFVFVIHKDDLEQYAQIIKSFLKSGWEDCFEIEPVKGTYMGRGTAFAGPAIGTIHPKGSTIKHNPNGTITIIHPEDD